MSKDAAHKSKRPVSDITTSDIATSGIAIVGGGMVGASLALLLARALPQKSIALLEAKPLVDAAESRTQPDLDLRSTALSPTSTELFARLGVWDSIEYEAAPIRRIHVSDRGHFGTSRFGPEDNQGKPLGYVVPNRVIGQALLQRVQDTANIEVHAPVEVSALKPIRGGVELSVDTGDVVAELAILADGAGSPLAAQIGITSSIKNYRQCAVIANVEHDKPHTDTAFERFPTRGPMALLPLLGELGGAHRSALVWTQPADNMKDVQGWSDREFLAQLQAVFGYRLGQFLRVGQRSVYPLALRLAEEQVRSSLVLMGNAAHFLHPVAGQGFNLALRDAARLAEVLVSGAREGLALGSLNVLQEYERAQQRDQSLTVSLSDGFIRIFSSGQPAVIAGRNLGLISLELFSGWRDIFLSQMAGRAQPRARLTL